MIRYPTRTAVIERLLRKRHPNWQAKAAQRTADHLAARCYIAKGEILPSGRKASEFWGEIKDVFVTVQYGKCAYCEMKIESGEAGGIQWDLEHFRPKATVTQWPNDLTTGPALPEGYYLLAYHPGNYLAACKTCNTPYKSTYFPIANARIIHGATPADHVSEGAYLIYVLGDLAEDPEPEIEFEDVEAKARNGSVRGQLLIDFFDLNREGLQKSRAEWLVDTYWNAFDGFRDGKPKAIRTMNWLLSVCAPHANCTRCYMALCLSDPVEAEHRYEKMVRMLKKYGRR